ncbi:MAG: hypothetical protein H0U19_02020, partial [Acidobacteria bacterium]|nr:hypothetical protein [Acidobacteriota bacterium]
MLIRPGLPAGAAALALIVLASLACSTQRSPASPALLIRDVTILSMDDETPRRGSVLVRGNRIEYVGPTPTLPPAPDAHIVEGSGRFLIPGLIDMH